MPGYIQALDILSTQARGLTNFSEEEILAAIAFLSRCPVLEYHAFTEQEVRLIAAYMKAASGHAYNAFWRSMVSGYPEAWTYAVHEAAELQAFAERSLNPFDAGQHNAYLAEAHLKATVQELVFLRAWAKQLQLRAPELAIEMENPIRSQSVRHKNFLETLRGYQQYPEPTLEELQIARQFWQRLTSEENL